MLKKFGGKTDLKTLKIMKVKDIAEKLKLNIFSGEDSLNTEVNGAYTSDLLSDVMGNAKADSLCITMPAHINIVAVASLKDLAAIIIVKGNKPDEDTLLQSKKEGISILGTDEQAFEISGKIYNLLKKE